MFIYSYNSGSHTARELAARLPARIIRHHHSQFRGRAGKLVINWGAAAIDNPEVLRSRVINTPNAVVACSNKLRFFETLGHSRSLPDWTSNPETAADWLGRGATVVARRVLTGHGGVGIVVVRPPQPLIDAPLYTKYVKKHSEWRVHIFNGEVIDTQRKARNLAVADNEVDWAVRTLRNGFIYVRDYADMGFAGAFITRLKESALAVFNETDLDFGAVDIIYNSRRDRFYTLEINSAPGLQGTTLRNYVEAFRNIAGDHQNA